MAIYKQHNLFNQNGCLTSKAIRAYIGGVLNLHDKMMVENHLKHCELCTEALKGYHEHLKSVHYKRDLNVLSRRVRQRFARDVYRQNRRIYVFLGFSIAAILVILILLYFLYRYFQLNLF